MVPEVINWEAVRCVSIDGATIRLVERDVEHEIAFPSPEALSAALRQWAAHSGKAADFFRTRDGAKSWDAPAAPSQPS